MTYNTEILVENASSNSYVCASPVYHIADVHRWMRNTRLPDLRSVKLLERCRRCGDSRSMCWPALSKRYVVFSDVRADRHFGIMP